MSNVIDATLAFQLRRSLVSYHHDAPMQCTRCLLLLSRREVLDNKAHPGACVRCGGECEEFKHA